jgi:hypothetical protein
MRRLCGTELNTTPVILTDGSDDRPRRQIRLHVDLRKSDVFDFPTHCKASERGGIYETIL